MTALLGLKIISLNALFARHFGIWVSNDHMSHLLIVCTPPPSLANTTLHHQAQTTCLTRRMGLGYVSFGPNDTYVLFGPKVCFFFQFLIFSISYLTFSFSSVPPP